MDARSILRAQDASRQNLVERDARRRAVLTNTYTGALTTTDWRVNGLADQKPVLDVGWTLPADSLNPRVDFWSNANLIASKMKAVIRSQVTGIDSRGPTPTAAASALVAAEARTHQPVFAMKPEILNGRSTSGALGIPSAKVAILSLANPNIPETLPFLQSIADRLIAKYQAVLNASSSVRHASREVQALAQQLGASREVSLRISSAITRSYFPGQNIESREEAEENERTRQEREAAKAANNQQAQINFLDQNKAQAAQETAESDAMSEAELEERFQEGLEYGMESAAIVTKFWQDAVRESFENTTSGLPTGYNEDGYVMYAYYLIHNYRTLGGPAREKENMMTKLKALLGYRDEPVSKTDGWAKRNEHHKGLDAFIKSVMAVLDKELAALKENQNVPLEVPPPAENASSGTINWYVFNSKKLPAADLQAVTTAMDEDAAPPEPMKGVEPATVAASDAAMNTGLTGKRGRPVGEDNANSASAPGSRGTQPAVPAGGMEEEGVPPAGGMEEEGVPPAGGMEVGLGIGKGKHKKSAKRRKLKGGAKEEYNMTTADAAAAARPETTAVQTEAVAAPAVKKATVEASSNTDVTPTVLPSTIEAVAVIATPLPAEPVVAPAAEDPAGKVPSTGQAPVVQKKKVQSKLPQGTVTTVPRASRDTYTPGTDLPRPLVPPTQWAAVQKTKTPKTELERRLA